MRKSIVLLFLLALTAAPSFASAHLGSRGAKAGAKAAGHAARRAERAAVAAFKFIF